MRVSFRDNMHSHAGGGEGMQIMVRWAHQGQAGWQAGRHMCGWGSVGCEVGIEQGGWSRGEMQHPAVEGGVAGRYSAAGGSTRLSHALWCHSTV